MDKLLTANYDQLLSAMPNVKNYDSRLGALNDWWGKIELIGKINSQNMAATILDDMGLAKGKFSELQQKLTRNLLTENLQKLVLDNASKAQVAIDLLIRNLFERTADVGFLATDDDIRQFLATDSPTDEQILFIENRLQEYVKKYSVYDEILIFDTQGRVKAHLDNNNPISQSRESLLAQTLASDQDYLETFGHSDLQANRRHSLIYSCKIRETGDSYSKPIGVLCLCFRFDDEIKGIFSDLLSQGRPGILTLIGSDGRVIASSDESQIPLQTPIADKGRVAIIDYHGQDYLTYNCETNGYQGFRGLAWRSQMLTPLGNTTFNRDESATVITAEYLDMMEQAKTFPKELRDIRHTSMEINADLGLLILNGQIVSARKKAAEFMPVLEAIKKIGSDISQIFDESVNSLETTVLSSYLDNAGFLATLAVDIMDRNLYERANDCRWWALTSKFRQNLAHSVISAEDKAQISEILAYINSLYTVYSNLYVYNPSGEILAVSNPAELGIVGTRLDEASAAFSAVKNTSSQQYGVSAFAATPLYQDRYTYIYNAAITDLNHKGRVLGGIGIVFDSEPQFQAMLEEVLPKDASGQFLTGSFALFADRNQVVIARANQTDIRIGDKFDLNQAFFELKAGQSSSDIIKFCGQNYVLGVAASKGYREYKTSDDYSNDVLAFVFIPF